MASVGFSVIAQESIQCRPSFLMQMNELHLLSLMDVPTGLSKAVDDFRGKHLERLLGEYSEGVSTLDGFLCVVARKPKLDPGQDQPAIQDS